MHNSNDCTDLKEFASLKNKKRAAAAETTKWYRCAQCNLARKQIPYLRKKVKKSLKKHKNKEKMLSIDKFADILISSSNEDENSSKINSSHKLDSE